MAHVFEEYDDLNELASRLRSGDSNEKRVVIMELADLGDPAAIPMLADTLDEADADVRQQAARALGEYDGPEAAAALARALVDIDPGVAAAASESMAELKDPASADPILPLVSHASTFVRTSALRALKE